MKRTQYSERQRRKDPDNQDSQYAIKHAEAVTRARNFDTDLSDTVSLDGFHTEEVTESDLSNYHQKQLEARLNYYEREYLFERNPQIRAECKREVDRTRTELNRRKFAARAEAEQVFSG